MNFAYPWILLLLLPFAAIVFYVWRRPGPSIRLPSVNPFKNSSSPSRRSLFSIPAILAAAAIAIIIIALARPRQGNEKIVVRAEGIDIIIAIDLSGSMEALDVPASVRSEQELVNAIKAGKIKKRIDVAKDEIAAFIAGRPNDRIGLIGFANLPYNVCPPTLDHAWLLRNLERLQPGSIGDKTGIAGPVASGVERLRKSDAKRRVMVLFTDGSNNVEARVSPRQAAKLAGEFDVTLYTVGIGSNRAYVLQRGGVLGDRFIPISDEFDEPLLKDMAESGKGKYYRAADSESLAAVMEEINKMEKTSVEQPRYIEYTEFGPRLVVAAMVMLLIAVVSGHSVFLKIP